MQMIVQDDGSVGRWSRSGQIRIVAAEEPPEVGPTFTCAEHVSLWALH